MRQRSATPRTGFNGDPNKVLVADRSVHEWYRFVLSFPPHLVREYVERFELNSRHCVLDPFCGTGTTLVECLQGISLPNRSRQERATFTQSDMERTASYGNA